MKESRRKRQIYELKATSRAERSGERILQSRAITTNFRIVAMLHGALSHAEVEGILHPPVDGAYRTWRDENLADFIDGQVIMAQEYRMQRQAARQGEPLPGRDLSELLERSGDMAYSLVQIATPAIRYNIMVEPVPLQ